MASTYLELAVFGAVALIVPILMLAFSRLVRSGSESNIVEAQPYESAEAAIGRGMPAMIEYSRYFLIFIAFSVLCAIMIVWSLASGQLDFTANSRIALLLAAGVFLEFYVLAMGRWRG